MYLLKRNYPLAVEYYSYLARFPAVRTGGGALRQAGSYRQGSTRCRAPV